MRNEKDRCQVTLSLHSVVDLDLERVEEDPLWQITTTGKDLSDRRVLEACLFEYINQYLIRGPRIMTNAPSTNGPSDLWLVKMEINQ
jgi:hypothetical protein